MSKELCRICLETSNLHLIFEETDNSENLTIAEKIEEISNIQIARSDDLPQFVCTECLQKIDNFIVFKSQIKSSHEYLQTVKWKVCDADALEIEELDSIQDQSFHTTVGANCELNITEVNKSELVEQTVESRRQSRDGSTSSEIEGQLQCSICGKLSSSKYRLKCHLKFHTTVEPYKHEKSFVESNNVKVHQRILTGECPNECHLCGKQFKTHLLMKYHVRRLHKGVISIDCPTCNKAFSNKRDLNKHIKGHTAHTTGSIIHECCQEVSCENTLEIQLPNSVQDESVHTAIEGNRGQDVTQVNKSEPFEDTVKSRKQNRNNLKSSQKRRQVQCTICGKLLSSKSRLKCHLRLHTGEKPYKCDKCEKSFAESNNLKVHQRIHTGEKPLECKFCAKKFNQGTGLKSHMRLHTGECPYECHICGKRFKTQSPLTYHIRLHTGEKSFVCSTCNKAFITKSDLNKHLKIHTGERPHQCSVCGKKFVKGSHLKRHMKTHFAEKSFKSEIIIIKGNPKNDI